MLNGKFVHRNYPNCQGYFIFWYKSSQISYPEDRIKFKVNGCGFKTFLFRYLKRLVWSLVYLPLKIIDCLLNKKLSAKFALNWGRKKQRYWSFICEGIENHPILSIKESFSTDVWVERIRIFRPLPIWGDV